MTYESGDIQRLVREASAEGVGRIIAGGGNGTINEVADALMRVRKIIDAKRRFLVHQFDVFENCRFKSVIC